MAKRKKKTEQHTNGEAKPEWSDVAAASADVSAAADTKTRHFSQELEVPTDPEETAENTKRLLLTLSTIEQIEGEKKEATREFNERLKEEKALAKRFADQVRTSTTTKKVKCSETWFFATGRAEIRRLDTNEVIDERALSLEERQQKLFDGEETRAVDPEPGPAEPTDITDPAAVADSIPFGEDLPAGVEEALG